MRMDNFWPLMRDQVTYQGKVYAVPHQGNCGLLHYNKNIFREVGLNPDKPLATWDEALTAVQRLTKRSGDTLERAGWVAGRGFGVPWMVPYWQLGGELMGKDEKKAIFNNTSATEAFDWLLKVHNAQGGEDAINQLYTGTNVNDAFAQGKTAMVWANNTIWRLNWANVPNLEIGVMSWPSPPNGKRSTYMGGVRLSNSEDRQEPRCGVRLR